MSRVRRIRKYDFEELKRDLMNGFTAPAHKRDAHLVHVSSTHASRKNVGVAVFLLPFFSLADNSPVNNVKPAVPTPFLSPSEKRLTYSTPLLQRRTHVSVMTCILLARADKRGRSLVGDVLCTRTGGHTKTRQSTIANQQPTLWLANNATT